MSLINIKRSHNSLSSPFHEKVSSHCSPYRPIVTTNTSLYDTQGNIKKIKSNIFPTSTSINNMSNVNVDMDMNYDRDPSPISNPSNTITSFDLETSLNNNILSIKKKKNTPVNKDTYTYDELKSIVSNIVVEREEQLAQDYENLLNEKIREQFEIFTKFNQDYIHRQMARSDSSYLS